MRPPTFTITSSAVTAALAGPTYEPLPMRSVVWMLMVTGPVTTIEAFFAVEIAWNS